MPSLVKETLPEVNGFLTSGLPRFQGAQPDHM